MASFLIDGKHLVDLGWNIVLRMIEMGHDPLAVETVIVTHLHQDHYIGLAPFLFYCGLKKRDQVRETPLTIIGTRGRIGAIVETTRTFLQMQSYQELETRRRVVGLMPGETHEGKTFRLETCATNHVSGEQIPAEGLAFRFTDGQTGASVAFTGDTSYHPPISGLARGADILIHDAAHSTATEAATIARAAQVGRLLLIHYRKADAEQLLTDAREVFPEAGLAVERETVTVTPRQRCDT